MQKMKLTDSIQTKISRWQKQIGWQDFNLILVGAMTLIFLMASGEGIRFLQPLRILLGLTYVLFIPGYCLTTALFPRINDLNNVERLSLSIGLSVACVSILTLLLDWLRLGLYPWPILLSELVVTGLFMAIISRRRSQIPLDVIYLPEILRQPLRNSLSLSKRRLYNMLAISLVVSGLAAWVSFTPISDQSTTEFYILGSEGLIADYPYQVKLNDEVRVNVGVRNGEKREITYHFEVWVTDTLNPERRERIMRSDTFLLHPGGKFEQSMFWHMPWAGDDQKVELLLFYTDDSKPYRKLKMSINVRE